MEHTQRIVLPFLLKLKFCSTHTHLHTFIWMSCVCAHVYIHRYVYVFLNTCVADVDSCLRVMRMYWISATSCPAAYNFCFYFFLLFINCKSTLQVNKSGTLLISWHSMGISFVPYSANAS